MPLFLYLWLVQAAIRCSDEMHDDEQLRFDNLCLNLNEPPRGSRPVKQSGRANLGLTLRSASHRRDISMATQPERRLFPRKSRRVPTSSSYSTVAKRRD